ncbi:MAG: RNA methyltransferase [bacterium]|nr:RNA methyltransferase [bacterium]
MTHTIESRSNPKVKALLKQRDNYFFFEGEKLVNDIITQNIEISFLIIKGTASLSQTGEGLNKRYNYNKKGTAHETWYVSAPVMSKLSSLKEPPGVMAVVEYKEKSVNWDEARIVIGLDNIQDPGNAGTVSRCAAAFGADGVVLTGASVKLNNPKFLRATQNAIFQVPHQRFEQPGALIREAEKAGFNIYLTSSRSTGNTLPPHQLEPPCLILLGNEGQGLEEELFHRYPSVKIPHADTIESLNAGISACIILYQVSSNLYSSPSNWRF